MSVERRTINSSNWIYNKTYIKLSHLKQRRSRLLWQVSTIINYFNDYARAMFQEYGDKVRVTPYFFSRANHICITVKSAHVFTSSKQLPVLKGHLFLVFIWNKEEVVFYDRCHLNRGSIQTKFSMIKQEKDDLLIQVTAY
jgi:hypothetical protein